MTNPPPEGTDSTVTVNEKLWLGLTDDVLADMRIGNVRTFRNAAAGTAAARRSNSATAADRRRGIDRERAGL
jgi:hypothetical protein